MNDTVNSRIQTYRLMQKFCISHSWDFAPASLGAQLFTKVSTKLSELPSRKLNQPQNLYRVKLVHPLTSGEYAFVAR